MVDSSSDRSLRPWSYIVLALVGSTGASAPEIVEIMERGMRLTYTASNSQIYAEPRHLEELGLLTATTEPAVRRPRTVYTLTDAGRAALTAWMLEPATLPKIQNPVSLRVATGDILSDDGCLLASLTSLRQEIEAMRQILDRNDGDFHLMPERERYLRLSNDLARRVLEAHSDWLDDLERELGGE